MKYIGKLLLFAIALIFLWMGYIVSSVFGLLRWPVFIIVCLFLGEIYYRIYKWICLHCEKQENR